MADATNRPRLCKLSLYRLHEQVLTTQSFAGFAHTPSRNPTQTYFNYKRSACEEYRRARIALKGSGGPFVGWVVSGEKYESFNVEGEVVTSLALTGASNEGISS